MLDLNKDTAPMDLTSIHESIRHDIDRKIIRINYNMVVRQAAKQKMSGQRVDPAILKLLSTSSRTHQLYKNADGLPVDLEHTTERIQEDIKRKINEITTRIDYNARITKAARRKTSGKKIGHSLLSELALSSGILRLNEDMDGYPVETKDIPEFIQEDINRKIDKNTVDKHELGNEDYKNVDYSNTIRDGEITFFRYTDIHEMSGGVLGCKGEDSISMLTFIKDIPSNQIVIEVVNNQTCELRCWDVKALAKSLIFMNNLHPMSRQTLSFKSMQVIAETLLNITPEQTERLDELIKESDKCFNLVTRSNVIRSAAGTALTTIVASICPLNPVVVAAGGVIMSVKSFIDHYTSDRSREYLSLHVKKSSYERLVKENFTSSPEYYRAIEQLSKNCVAKIKIEKKKQEKKKQEKKKQEKKKQEKKKQEKKKQEAGRKVVENDSSSSYKSAHKSDKSRKRSRS